MVESNMLNIGSSSGAISNWSSKDWDIAQKHALQGVRLGREVLLRYFGKLTQVQEKFQAGLVSEADKESEKEISRFLANKFPDTEFLGEESSSEQEKSEVERDLARHSSKGRWILDPLDGTTNYVHRFPIFCISLALEVGGEVVMGVIDVPMLNETYTAIKGKGAFVNGRPLSVSKKVNFAESFLATGFNRENPPVLKEQMQIFDKIVRDARGIRRPGAAAYDLCMVAAGIFDGYWEKGIRPWDIAAGLLIVREAGGSVLEYDGKQAAFNSPSIVAGNPAIASELVKRISENIK